MSTIALRHRQRVMRLYRHSLKNILYFVGDRGFWIAEAAKLRATFDKHINEPNFAQAERLVEQGEALLRSRQHPDPYIVPYFPGGSLYARNPPPPKWLHHLDFGREGYH